MSRKQDTRDRFYSKLRIANNGCWGWSGSKNERGYGYVRSRKKTTTAHRYSWEIHFGEIPHRACVLRTCATKDCSNPDHLFLRPHLTHEARFESRWTEDENGCWIWSDSLNSSGYGTWWDGGKNISAHRSSWERNFGGIPNGKHVLHKCDVRNCVNPNHLFIGDVFSNMADMVEKGRSCTGERNGMSRLSEDQVLEIKRLYSEGGITQRELGEIFGILGGSVNRIINGRRWSHIQ